MKFKKDFRKNKGFTRLVDFRDAISSRTKSASRKLTTGFTLIELLLVVAGIAILATIVFVVLSPADTLNKFRDASRSSNIQAIMSAMSLYAIDNNGDVPNKADADWGSTAVTICGGGVSCAIPLSDLTDDSKYLTEFPTDPSGATEFFTAKIDAAGLVTIDAPLAAVPPITVKGKFNPI